LWKQEMNFSIPLPERLFSSPLSRATHTLQVTFLDILTDVPPLIVENLRETTGLHTCDKRSEKSKIHQAFPSFSFEDGFSEEDELWEKDVRESEGSRDKRVKLALDQIFGTNDT